MDFHLMAESWPQMATAVPKTLLLAGTSLALGFVLGLGLALMRFSSVAYVRNFSYGYVYVFRATPLLVQLFLIYYGSGQFRPQLEAVGLWILFKEAWFCAILALTLNTSAYTAEIIRGGILSVPDGLADAGRALGLSRPLVLRHVVLPIAFRQALPAYGNEIILMVKATSLASTITILELTGVSKKIIAATWSPVEIFVMAGAIYLVINVLVVHAVRFLEIRMSPAAAQEVDQQPQTIGH